MEDKTDCTFCQLVLELNHYPSEAIMIVGFTPTMRETLADFVRRIRLEKGFSTSDVERNSKGKISDSYVSRIENGFVKTPSLEKLEALANGLRIAPIEIFRVWHGDSPGEPKNRAEILIEAFGGQGVPMREVRAIEKMLETWFEQQRRESKTEIADESIKDRPASDQTTKKREAPAKPNFKKKKV